MAGCEDGTCHVLQWDKEVEWDEERDDDENQNVTERLILMDPQQLGDSKTLDSVQCVCVPCDGLALTFDCKGRLRTWDLESKSLFGLTHSQGHEPCVAMYASDSYPLKCGKYSKATPVEGRENLILTLETDVGFGFWELCKTKTPPTLTLPELKSADSRVKEGSIVGKIGLKLSYGLGS